MNKPVFRFAVALSTLLLGASCAGLEVFEIRPIEAWVVDADTGKPIEGANVVANWQVVGGSLDGTRDRGTIEAKETVTDIDGRFYFDGFHLRNSTTYHLWNQDPRIIIFKPGYQMSVHRNSYHSDYNFYPPGPVRTSQLGGQKVRLRKQLSDEQSISFGLSRVVSQMSFAYETEGCWWKKVPRMVLTIDAESRSIAHLGTHVGGRINRLPSGTCGSPDEFLSKFKK